MKKQLIIKNEVVEMTFEETLKLFTPSIHKEINRQKANFNRDHEEIADMFQDASLYLWKAFEKYDIETGYHFSTYAKHYIQRGAQSETVKNNAQKRDGQTVSMDENLNGDDDTFTLNNLLSEEVDFDSPLIEREIINEAILLMTNLEVEYLFLMLNDYTIQEAADKKGVAKGTVQEKFRKIRAKLKETGERYNY